MSLPPRRTRPDEENAMSNQSQPTVAAVSDKVPARMKLRFHIYPDARATSRLRYCSAWSRRYGRSSRAVAVN